MHTHKHGAAWRFNVGADPSQWAGTVFGIRSYVGQDKHEKRHCTGSRMEGFASWLPARSGPCLPSIMLIILSEFIVKKRSRQSETQQEQPITDQQQADGDEIISDRLRGGVGACVYRVSVRTAKYSYVFPLSIWSNARPLQLSVSLSYPKTSPESPACESNQYLMCWMHMKKCKHLTMW